MKKTIFNISLKNVPIPDDPSRRNELVAFARFFKSTSKIKYKWQINCLKQKSSLDKRVKQQ